MTPSEVERLVRLETKVEDIGETVVRIEDKLDGAIQCKADKDEVDRIHQLVKTKADADDFKEMRRLLVGILISIAGTALLMLSKILGLW